MDPLISVIVPVYNVEDYLNRCVESIVNQTYSNLEIILVDDGSTDSSGEKCDEWAEKDKRIVVIHKENVGLSDARNKGLEIAKGEYIGFVDSDDYISIDMYRILFDTITKTSADIAECRWLKFSEENEIQCITVKQDQCIIQFSTEKALLELILERNHKQTVWNKLYKKRVICNGFPVGRINEDEFWTYQVFGNANRTALIDLSLYFYFQRDNSIMHVKYSPKRLDGIIARKERMVYMKKNYPALFAQACLSYVWACFYHYQVICRNNEVDMDRKYRKMLHSEYCDYCIKEVVDLQSYKQRLWMKSFKLFPDFTCRVRNILRIGL